MIVATAGHVDHGKTALIRALTGIDTDRLPEEKKRGLSIDLGFAYQSLPDDASLGFVDVPGHEKFIRNMLAGVGGIDLGLLVVAADDGVMPQTREHLAILDLLGIERYLVAITKIDRVEDDRVAAVRHQVETLLAQTGIAGADIFPVCAPEHEGVDALQAALRQRAQDCAQRDADGHFRMAIDRVFTLKGVGLVVTGMVSDGAVRIDDRLLLSADGSPVRVRGIRANDRAQDSARAGERCAINLAGRQLDENRIRRGHWLLHASLYAPTRRIDVDLRVLEAGTRALKHWTPVHLHIGAARLAARVAVLGGGSIAAGERGLAQLVLARDACVLQGDRFVLRDQSARHSIGGGRVIDPLAPKRGRARPERIAALRAMNRRDPGEALDALARQSRTGVARAAFALSNNLPGPRVDSLIDALSLLRVGSGPAERLFDASRWQDLLDRVAQAVAVFHESKPGLAGATLTDIQLGSKPYIETGILAEVIGTLVQQRKLGRRGARLHLPTHALPVSEHDRRIWEKVEPYIAPQSGSPSSLHQAAEAIGVDPEVLEKSLKNALELGNMAQIANNRYVTTAHLAGLANAAEALAAESDDGCFTATAYCQRVGTGRNFAIDLLEYFDRRGFTERTGNTRRIRQPAASVFAVADTST